MSEKLYARLKFRKRVAEKYYTDIEVVAEIHSLSGQAPYFSITGSTWNRGREDSGGCIHEEIEKHFPFLKKYIKWHLTSTKGPMHYLANTLYLAGDKDYNGLRKDEVRQLRNGRTGKPVWITALVDVDGNPVNTYDWTQSFGKFHTIEADEQPEPPPLRLVYLPWNQVGEGKARQLDSARSTAVWPEATDEELMADDLEEKLKARLPELMKQFRADMKELFETDWKTLEAPQGVQVDVSIRAAVSEEDIF